MSGGKQFDSDVLAGLAAAPVTTDPTPEEIFAAKLNAPAPPQGLLGRAQTSGLRLAGNPVVQAGLALPAGPLGGLVRPGLNAAVGTRDPASFTREIPDGPETVNLKAQGPSPFEDPNAFQGVPTLQQLKAPSLLGGSGGMSPSRAAWDASRQKLLDDYDTDKHLQYVQGANRADEVAGRARLQVEEAAIKQRHAELQQAADAEAAVKHEAFLKRNQELADDIGAKRTSVEQVFGDTVGDLGMVVGGILMARGGHMEQALAQFNRRMDDSLKRQQLEIENKKVKLQARQSVFGQMMQETGDRRMAALQTRNLMLESAKQRLMADADRLGIPSVKTNAEIAVNKLQHEQDGLNEQIQREGYQTAVANARAAASARAAEEEKAYRRMVDAREYALKLGHLQLDAKKLEREGADDLDKKVTALGKEMSDPKLAEGRAAVESVKRRLDGKPEDEGVPGVGGAADARERLAPKPSGAAALNPGAWANYAVAGLNKEERLGRQDMARLFDAYRVQTTGAGAGKEEIAALEKSFLGAKTPAEQRNAIAQAEALYKQLEARKMASADERTQAEFKRRLGAQK